MYHIYVMRSLRNGKRYVGMTSRDLQTRLHEHKIGISAWTRQNGPFKLVHTEEYSDRLIAQRRERFLKSGHGRDVLSRILSQAYPSKGQLSP